MATADPKILANARSLLKKGDLDGAVREFVQADAHEEAARALGQARRFIEGAELLLNTLGVRTNELAKLRDPHLRARAQHAASLLRQGGFGKAADEIETQLDRSDRFGPGGAPDKTLRSAASDLSDEKTQIGRPNSQTGDVPPTMLQLEPLFDVPEPTKIEPRAPIRSSTPAPPKMATPPKVATPIKFAAPPKTEPAPAPDVEEQTTRPPQRMATATGNPVRRNTRDLQAAQARPSSVNPAKLEPGFQEGAVIAERYELGPLIGRGGMGRVFRATDREIGQQIAIKVFDRMDDATLLARFKQELLSSRSIAHPNVVRLFDIGTYADHKYLTMELLVGQDLKERLAQPIAVSESLDLLIQACRGLEAAHLVGVIHRDIKPQNLFITEQRVVKIMDFGIAKFSAAAKLTSPGMGVGTPEFMAPEQIVDSSKVSPATDLYAIGVTAYRMCTGRVPFGDKDMLKLLKKQLKEDPPPPRSINPRLPPQLEVIILKLLLKDPAARYQKAGEVAEAFLGVRKLFATPAH